MISWKDLKSENELHFVIQKSYDVPIAIFKHSTFCEISTLVKSRLELQWDIPHDALDVYCVDLHAHRPVSNEIARRLGVLHESPQLIVIKDGQPIYDASHADVNVEELRNALDNGVNVAAVAT
jgi:bacillithiol system protein YtxJ